MEYRARQVEVLKKTGKNTDEAPPHITDEEIFAAINDNQLKVMKERGIKSLAEASKLVKKEGLY